MENQGKDSKQEQIRKAYEEKIEVEYIPATKKLDDEVWNRTLRVAPYCRVSTNSSEQMASYELQVQYFTEMVNNHPGWVLVEVFSDPAVSGTSTKKRKGFQKMIAACKRGEIDMIITKQVSRFARNVIDVVETARMLKTLDPPVAIFFEDVGINTLTQTGELLLVVLAAIAQGESETKSSSVRWGFQKRFENGLPKISDLYGYVKDGRDLYIDETEAAVVRLIYQMFVDGCPIRHIVRFLNDEGIPSPRDSEWCITTLRNLIENEKYCGDVLMQKTVTVDVFSHKSIKNDGRAPQYRVQGHHEPIVDKELWEQAQAILASPSPPKTSWSYWLDDEEAHDLSLDGFHAIKHLEK